MHQHGQVIQLKTQTVDGRPLWAYRYMGASLTTIDRHYGHLARDGRQHAISLLDAHATRSVDAGGRSVDTNVAPDSSVGGTKSA